MTKGKEKTMAGRTRMLRRQLDQAILERDEAVEVARKLESLLEGCISSLQLQYSDIDDVFHALTSYPMRLPSQAPTDGQYSYLKVCIAAELEHWSTLLKGSRIDPEWLETQLKKLKSTL